MILQLKFKYNFPFQLRYIYIYIYKYNTASRISICCQKWKRQKKSWRGAIGWLSFRAQTHSVRDWIYTTIYIYIVHIELVTRGGMRGEFWKGGQGWFLEIRDQRRHCWFSGYPWYIKRKLTLTDWSNSVSIHSRARALYYISAYNKSLLLSDIVVLN